MTEQLMLPIWQKPPQEWDELDVDVWPQIEALGEKYWGTQRLVMFQNGYGASIVQHFGSYGHEQGLYELAVIEANDSETHFSITYDTPISDDVMGYLTPDECMEILVQIHALEAPVHA